MSGSEHGKSLMVFTVFYSLLLERHIVYLRSGIRLGFYAMKEINFCGLLRNVSKPWGK